MKLKICSSCGIECYLWKSAPKLCKSCALKNAIQIGSFKMTSKSSYKIKHFSDKKLSELAIYRKLRDKHLNDHPVCEAKILGCTYIGTDIHHLYSGADRYKYFLKPNTWKTVCRSCHNKIHDVLSSKELIELDLRRKD